MARALVIVALIPLLAPQRFQAAGQQEAIPKFGKLLKETVARGWRWRAYWEGPDKLRHYVPGVQVRLLAIRSGAEALVCIPELGQTFEILVIRPDKLKVISLMMSPPQENCEQEMTRFRRRNWPLRDLEQLARVKEKAGLSSQEARQPPMPAYRLPRDRTFSQEEYTWVLPALSLPEFPIVISEPEAADLEETVRQEALKRWRPECGEGYALIPRFSPQDDFVFVYVDLGGKCEKGVVDVIRDLENRLTLGRFTTGEYNLDWLLPRIRNILFRRIGIGR